MNELLLWQSYLIGGGVVFGSFLWLWLWERISSLPARTEMTMADWVPSRTESDYFRGLLSAKVALIKADPRWIYQQSEGADSLFDQGWRAAIEERHPELFDEEGYLKPEPHKERGRPPPPPPLM